MLQPLQLKEVSSRHPQEIAELRDFLRKTGIPIETPQSLSLIAARLRVDAAFHRDLISYIWVVIDSCGRSIHYSDLLGVLALAAAGTDLASTTDGEVAHSLLRFVMEARHSFESAGSSTNSVSVAPEPVLKPVLVPVSDLGNHHPSGTDTLPEVGSPEPALTESPQIVRESPQTYRKPTANVSAFHRTSVPVEVDEREKKRTAVLWMLAASMAAILIAGVYLFHTPSSVSNTKPAPAAAISTTSQTTLQPPINQPESNTAPIPVQQSNGRTSTAPPTSHAKPTVYTQPYAASAAPSRAPQMQPQPSFDTTQPQTPAPAPVTSNTPRIPAAQQTVAALNNAVRAPAPTAAAPIIRGAAPRSAPVAIPSSDLSQRVGARTLPSDSAETAYHPVLHRREPLKESVNTNIAGNYAANIPPLSAGTRALRGTVRASTEGITGESLIYGPAPPYPAAAAAAHVQGEVRVHASVGSDGNVAAARVISGPAMLRDAALDAVHHWRFRPQVVRGHAVSMSATAVLEFELE